MIHLNWTTLSSIHFYCIVILSLWISIRFIFIHPYNHHTHTDYMLFSGSLNFNSEFIEFKRIFRGYRSWLPLNDIEQNAVQCIATITMPMFRSHQVLWHSLYIWNLSLFSIDFFFLLFITIIIIILNELNFYHELLYFQMTNSMSRVRFSHGLHVREADYFL